MELRALGNTDLQISPLGLGTVQLGMPYGIGLPEPPPEPECIHFLRRAFAAGITFFDTAAAYGRSEELIGRAFAGSASRPVIATKVLLREPGSPTMLRGQALRQQVEASVRRSLQRLGIEAIDLLQIHSVENRFVGPEILELIEDLTRRGWVRYWGASTYGEEASLEVLAVPNHLRTLQVAYSALDRRLEKRVFPACRQQGTGLILRSIFLKGVLSERFIFLPPKLQPLRNAAMQLKRIAEEAGIALSELALRFAAYCPYAHVTLFGSTSFKELEANLAALAAGPLPPEVMAAVDVVEVPDQRLLDPRTWES